MSLVKKTPRISSVFFFQPIACNTNIAKNKHVMIYIDGATSLRFPRATF